MVAKTIILVTIVSFLSAKTDYTAESGQSNVVVKQF